MNIVRLIADLIGADLRALPALEGVEGLDAALAKVAVTPTRDPSHGDLATNAAMVLSKPARSKPRDLAEALVKRLQERPEFTSVEIAGPGFVNLRLAPSLYQQLVGRIVALGTSYGDSDQGGGVPVNVEYVSANPTGPLHLGHARGAIFGDTLSGLLAKAGWAVTKEYYINDAGSQVLTLARSVHLRYREAVTGETADIPEGLYPGDYLIPVGEALAASHGDALLHQSEEEWLPVVRRAALDAMMALIREDLAAANIRQNVFSSEAALVDSGAVDATLDALAARDLVFIGKLEPPKGKPVPDDFEPTELTLFRATQFGDEVDRPVRRSTGETTYFAPDIAYHADKFDRGFGRMINVWGADHGGYVKRMTAAVQAVTEGKGSLTVVLGQMVGLVRDGEPVKMSKRSGTFITMREVVDEVGSDIIRLHLAARHPNEQMEFDVAEATKVTNENVFYYLQYAHARCRSIQIRGTEAFPGLGTDAGVLAGAPLDRLSTEADMDLIKLLAVWPMIVESAAQALEPHRIVGYMKDLAAGLHQMWNRGNEDPALRFVLPDDAETTQARLALATAVKATLASGFTVLGITPLDQLVREEAA